MNTPASTLGGSLSPELCRRIARWTHRLDLPRLALACKSFQVASEKRLYESLVLGEPFVALIVCQTIAEAKRLGPYVREFYIYQEDRRARDVSLPLEFWTAVQDAMSAMSNLEFLYIHDNGSNTFILHPPRITFQLKSAQLHMDWDGHLVSFLSGQHRLNDLLLSEGPRSPGAGVQLQLPHLKHFAGTITAAAQLVSSPLTHMHIEAAAVTLSLDALIKTLANFRKTLRSLCVINVPESNSLEALQLISTTIPNLRYLGILCIQSHNREDVHRCLMKMHELRVLEINITNWEPQVIGPFQKVLVSELRVYCPSIQRIAIWTNYNRCDWILDGDTWNHGFETGHNSRVEQIWKTV